MSTPSMWQGVARVGVAEAAVDISAFADGEQLGEPTKCTWSRYQTVYRYLVCRFN